MATHNDFRSASFRGRSLGYIDPVVAANVATSVFEFASNIFGKDNVPNYPIKSGNTYTKLIGIVQQKVPGPPTSVEHAKQLVAMAQAALQAEQGGSGSANETIKMMYQQVIAALQAYINAGGSGYNSPISQGGGTPAPGGVVYQPGSLPTPGSGSNFLTNTGFLGLPNWVTLGGGAAAIYFLTRKKRRR